MEANLPPIDYEFEGITYKLPATTVKFDGAQVFVKEGYLHPQVSINSSIDGFHRVDAFRIGKELYEAADEDKVGILTEYLQTCQDVVPFNLRYRRLGEKAKAKGLTEVLLQD